MWKKVLLGIVVVLAVFVVVVWMQPSTFRITRTGTMEASPAVVFGHVNDFHAWEAWSPWAKLDPQSKVVFEGAPAGTGAIFKWTGNEKVGEGSMEILESKPAELVRIKLVFVKPFAGVCETLFTFKPEGKGTAVTWTMSGENNFMGKAFCLFMNQDKMVGGDFEKGLANMKTVMEGATATMPATMEAATRP